MYAKSKDTVILIDVLSKAIVGQTVTYNEMSTAIGRDVQEYARSSLDSALQGCLKLGVVLENIRDVGYKRIGDKEIVDASDGARKSVNKKVSRCLKKLSIAKYENLDAEGKRKHVAMSAVMGTLQLFSTKSAAKKIEKRVSESTDVLPVGETLKLFGG